MSMICGGTFTSFTVNTISLLTVSLPSLAATVTVYVPWALNVVSQTPTSSTGSEIVTVTLSPSRSLTTGLNVTVSPSSISTDSSRPVISGGTLTSFTVSFDLTTVSASPSVAVTVMSYVPALL